MKFWQHLLSKLRDSQRVYLITVIENIGSSPGRKGFKMMVSEDNFIYGSIGGGVMEFSLVEEARKLLHEKTFKTFLKKQVHRRRQQDRSGMICSGEQTVVYHPLDHHNIATVENILDCIQHNKKGGIELTNTSIKYLNERLEKNFECNIASPKDWYFKEQIGLINTLHLIGGGHVSIAVSDLFAGLGFKVIVYDNRKNLNTLELNTSAHQKLIIDFNNIANHISESSESYVAIMTNRYVDDKLVLDKLMAMDFAYIGVLGSVAKLKKMWNAFQDEGVPISKLNNIHGPIGLSIKSQTPQEIAISIAAEVIKIKNKNQ